MPPFNGVVLLLIAFPCLVWLLDGAHSARQAAADGWRFGFGFFTPGLYWTALSMFVDIKQFWFMVPFALFGLPAMLACWVGLGTGLARMRLAGHCFPVASLRGIVMLAACWTVGEWLRGHALTGFPWALIGYTWSGDSPVLTAILQLSSITGIYGVSLVTIIMVSGPAALASRTPNFRHRRTPVIAGLVLFLAIGAWGAHRLRGVDPVWPDMRIRIVQPNIPQTADYSAETTFANFRHVLSLAKAPAEKPLAAEVWPEAAVDYYLNRDANARLAVAATVPKGGVVLTGTLRATVTDPIKDVWNSVVAVNGAGDIIASYDKNHLVPFGEYVPFRSILPINKIVADRFDFSTGPGPQTLPLQSVPSVSPIICYEAIFPHAVVDEANRPAWLLNVTNDAWFGTSIGPPQHLMISRVRAIEEGLPLLRAANTGISGEVDPHGRILKRLGLGVSGVLDVDLPKPLAYIPLYARFGDWILLLMVIAGAGLALLIRPRSDS